MAKTLMWMFRAGEGGYLFDEFRKDSIVAVGWNEIGDLTGSIPRMESAIGTWCAGRQTSRERQTALSQ